MVVEKAPAAVLASIRLPRDVCCTPRVGLAVAVSVFADPEAIIVPAALVVGYVAVVATQLVPSDRKIVPTGPAVVGKVAVVHVGLARAPCDTKNCPAEPVAVTLTPLVALPMSTPLMAKVLWPVPPLATGRMPVTPAVRLICAQVDTPDPLVVSA